MADRIRFRPPSVLSLLPLLAPATLLLAACAVQAETVSPPVDATGTFTLRLDEVDRRDSVFEVEALGAPRGSQVFLVVANAEAVDPACPAAIAPVCLSVPGRVVLDLEGTTDEDGEAWWYIPFGAAGPGGEIAIQAFVSPGWVSNGLIVQVP